MATQTKAPASDGPDKAPEADSPAQVREMEGLLKARKVRHAAQAVRSKQEIKEQSGYEAVTRKLVEHATKNREE